MTAPDPDPIADAARIRRNKLFGRIVIVALGVLVLIQIAPMLMRMFLHQPA
jgi:hypothetical protein